jgi:hypothetical protein
MFFELQFGLKFRLTSRHERNVTVRTTKKSSRFLIFYFCNLQPWQTRLNLVCGVFANIAKTQGVAFTQAHLPLEILGVLKFYAKGGLHLEN